MMGLRSHLELSNFSLSNHRRPLDFYTSRFTRVSGTPYLFWRVFWAVYHTAWLVAGPLLAARDAVRIHSDGDDGGEGEKDVAAVAAGKWFIYLSHWVYLVLATECVMEAAVVVMVRKGTQLSTLQTRDNHLAWTVRVMWLLSTVSLVGSVMICLWYWTMLHKGRKLTAPRINTHGVAALYCILDLLVSQKPLRLLHIPYTVLFGLIYTSFSAIYYLAGGCGRHGSPSIYPVLDWSSPWRTLVISSISNFLVIPIVHAVLWGLGLLFETVGKSCGGAGGGGGRRESSREKGVRRNGEETPDVGSGYDVHVDTETTSWAGNSRNSRTVEDAEACNTLDSAQYLIDERSLA